MSLTKEQKIMQAIEIAQMRIEHNNTRIKEIEAINQSLQSSINLLKFQLRQTNGFGDSMNFGEDGIGLNLSCAHNKIDENGVCEQCKEKIG